MIRVLCVALLAAGMLAALPAPAVATSFVNWENPHVHPLDVTPDRTLLLAVNTPDNRLELFDVRGGTAVALDSVAVGLDPVSVRARTNDEAWVVNHISDSVSIVDLTSRNVVATLDTRDEPTDVVFAGNPERAFVSCSQANTIQVFDPADLSVPPVDIAIDAEDPRAMAVSPDGATVYAAIFESGNRSTILGGGNAVPGIFPPNVVDDPASPYGGVNPPPNNGVTFDPPINPANPTAPPVGLIVKQNAAGAWLDDNGGDWTALVSGPQAGLSGRPVGWSLSDHDLAIVNANTLAVSYASGLMNLCMALGVNPATAEVTVVGTDGTNELRFEPNLNGIFLRVLLGTVDPAQPATPTVGDLNPHLTYAVSSVPQPERDRSLGDPRGIVWNAAGTRGYVTGMGSDNVVVIDPSGARAGLAPTVEVGEGPTGVVLDEPRGRLYVLNKFAASVSVVDLVTETELTRVPFFDPTPSAIRDGRQHLYDTHGTSGLGHASCASCHPDARIDRLAWDLGNPAGTVKTFNQNCNFGASFLGSDPCDDWHPMKGPMVTQTLQDIIGKEPHHWRGDRDGLEEFNQTFTNLQAADAELTPTQMQQLEDFLATIHFPPNPFRTFQNGLSLDLDMSGHYFTGLGGAAGDPLPSANASRGKETFEDHHLVQGFAASCSVCHTRPTGVATNDDHSGGTPQPVPPGPNGELHHGVIFSSISETPDKSIKAPHLRNLYEKVGFDLTQPTNRAGFGFLHDGSIDSLVRFMSEPFFEFDAGLDGPPSQTIPDMVAFMLSFSGSDMAVTGGIPVNVSGPSSQDTHAAVGVQITVHDGNKNDAATVSLINDMIAVADAAPDFTPGPEANIVVRGVQGGLVRGYHHTTGGLFQSDRAAETPTADALRLAAGAGSELTFTMVPEGTQTRIGTDRDEDGALDRDERDACSDPADAASVPGAQVAILDSLRLDRSGTDTVLTWSAVGASWDVVEGDLSALRSSGGDFTSAVDGCAGEDLVAPTLVLPEAPGPAAQFFLVRAACAGGATYESGGPGQAGARDPEINTAAAACAG